MWVILGARAIVAFDTHVTSAAPAEEDAGLVMIKHDAVKKKGTSSRAIVFLMRIPDVMLECFRN